MNKSTCVILVCAVAITVASTGLAAAPLGTGFTYQGRLLQSGQVADGEFDFVFELFDDPCTAIANLIGVAVDVNAQDVIDGYFTVELDFGSNVFDGNDRWLQIGVRSGELEDPNTYEFLQPLQRIAAAPYSLYAKQAAETQHAVIADSAAHAGSASHSDTANSAGTANTADNATHAGNADTVDGQHSSAFAAAGHGHLSVPHAVNADSAGNANYATTAGSSAHADHATNADIATTAEDADTVDGLHSASFSLAGHIHDGRYYTETELQTSGSASVHWDNLTNVPGNMGADADWAIDGNNVYSKVLGNVGIGTNSFGTSAANVLAIGAGVSPTTSAVGGVQLYAEDSLDGDTKLLLHFDGDFLDSSASGHAVTAQGDARIDASQQRFGSGSSAFDGSGDYLTIPDHSDWFFGTGDFTIDFWARFWSLPPNGNSFEFFSQYITANNQNQFYIYNNNGTYELKLHIDDGGVETIKMIRSIPNVVVDAWYHFAAVRAGDKWYLFQNGLQLGTAEVNNNPIPDRSAVLTIGGKMNGQQYMDGHLDEYRVSSVARWTSSFTPPLSEYGGEFAELRVRDELGNITTLSPHNFRLVEKSEPMAWSFYSRNDDRGFEINVDMLKALRVLEKLSGEKLVHIRQLDVSQD